MKPSLVKPPEPGRRSSTQPYPPSRIPSGFLSRRVASRQGDGGQPRVEAVGGAVQELAQVPFQVVFRGV